MKLPIFKAFFAGWAYLASHALTILKILWLPALLLMAAYVYFMPSMADTQASLSTLPNDDNAAEVFKALGPMMQHAKWLYLALAIIYPMMIAGVLKHVVRGESPALPFYFRFFGDELRILVAYILFYIMVLLLTIVGVLAAFVLGMGLMAVSPAIGGIVASILMIAFVIILIWFLLRLSVFFPAAIGSRSLGIPESWQVTKGNAWRLVAYWILWGIAILIVASIFMAFNSTDYFQFIGDLIAAGQDKAAQQEVVRRMVEMQQQQWDMSRPGFWPFVVAYYVFTIVYTAMWTVASGVAYRYLSGQAERAE